MNYYFHNTLYQSSSFRLIFRLHYHANKQFVVSHALELSINYSRSAGLKKSSNFHSSLALFFGTESIKQLSTYEGEWLKIGLLRRTFLGHIWMLDWWNKVQLCITPMKTIECHSHTCKLREHLHQPTRCATWFTFLYDVKRSNRNSDSVNRCSYLHFSAGLLLLRRNPWMRWKTLHCNS